jgi:hypothetical protein
VYAHADELGAVPLTKPGEGRKPRLRFDLDLVRQRRGRAEQPPPPRVTSGTKRQPTAPLLPIAGDQS